MRAEPTRHVRERNQRLLLLYRNEYIHNCQDWLSLGGTLLGSAAARRRFGIGRSAWWKSLAKPSPTPRRAESRPATAPLRRRMRRDPHLKASIQQGSPPPISERPPPTPQRRSPWPTGESHRRHRRESHRHLSRQGGGQQRSPRPRCHRHRRFARATPEHVGRWLPYKPQGVKCVCAEREGGREGEKEGGEGGMGGEREREKQKGGREREILRERVSDFRNLSLIHSLAD